MDYVCGSITTITGVYISPKQVQENQCQVVQPVHRLTDVLSTPLDHESTTAQTTLSFGKTELKQLLCP